MVGRWFTKSALNYVMHCIPFKGTSVMGLPRKKPSLVSLTPKTHWSSKIQGLSLSSYLESCNSSISSSLVQICFVSGDLHTLASNAASSMTGPIPSGLHPSSLVSLDKHHDEGWLLFWLLWLPTALSSHAGRLGHCPSTGSLPSLESWAKLPCINRATKCSRKYTG